MANLSLREAVKHFAVSRPTLQKALSSGKITGVRDGQGHWTIDSSELARVYPPRLEGGQAEQATQPAKLATTNTAQNTLDSDELVALTARLGEAERRASIAEALAEERGRHIEDLRRMLPSPAPARGSFLARLLGR
jgi:excisionase family DNA binding protein